MVQYCIQTQALSKRFGNKTVLDNLNLEIQQGGIHALVGSNGAGKSTLFRVLLGLLSPSSGHASVLGEDSQYLSAKLRGRVACVNEEHTLPGWMKAQQVIDFQRSFYPLWDQRIYDSVIGYFEVNLDQKVSSLSHGERAGLNLAIVFAQQPELFILDEPTLGLDIVAKQSILEAVMSASANSNTTIVYCSHEIEDIERLADQLIILERGRVLNNSSPDQLLERTSYWIADTSTSLLPDKEHIPGFLAAREIDSQMHIWVLDQGEEFAQFLKSHGAETVQQCGVSMTGAVKALLTKNHHRPEGQAR